MERFHETSFNIPCRVDKINNFYKIVSLIPLEDQAELKLKKNPIKKMLPVEKKIPTVTEIVDDKIFNLNKLPNARINRKNNDLELDKPIIRHIDAQEESGKPIITKVHRSAHNDQDLNKSDGHQEEPEKLAIINDNLDGLTNIPNNNEPSLTKPVIHNFDGVRNEPEKPVLTKINHDKDKTEFEKPIVRNFNNKTEAETIIVPDRNKINSNVQRIDTPKIIKHVVDDFQIKSNKKIHHSNNEIHIDQRNDKRHLLIQKPITIIDALPKILRVKTVDTKELDRDSKGLKLVPPSPQISLIEKNGKIIVGKEKSKSKPKLESESEPEHAFEEIKSCSCSDGTIYKEPVSRLHKFNQIEEKLDDTSTDYSEEYKRAPPKKVNRRENDSTTDYSEKYQKKSKKYADSCSSCSEENNCDYKSDWNQRACDVEDSDSDLSCKTSSSGKCKTSETIDSIYSINPGKIYSKKKCHSSANSGNAYSTAHMCDHIKKLLEFLKKTIDNTTMLNTIICLVEGDSTMIQSILGEILEMYNAIIEELSCGTNSAVLTCFVEKFEKYRRIVTKIKNCKYQKLQATDMLIKINKNQCQILKVFMAYEKTFIKRHLNDLDCID